MTLTLLAIRQSDGRENLGKKVGDRVIDLRGAGLPATVDEALRQGRLSDIAKADGPAISESAITHGRLFADPGKLICIGLNYRRHAQEVGAEFPKAPVVFSKFNNALAGHGGVLTLPPSDITSKVDYETELVIVIGKRARDIAEADALSCVAGYCVGNDVSARDLQGANGGQWLLGKTLDGFAPIGPYFVSADQIADPNDLRLETWVNGEKRQDSRTSDFIFNCQQMISYLSRQFTLEPGDLIFTGTPQGVILGFPKEKRVWLKAGDVIESRIEKLGTLTFTLAGP